MAKLTNLITNGGFEVNTTGWTSNFSGNPTRIAVSTPRHTEDGSWCGQNSGSINGAHYIQRSAVISTVSNSRYYIRARIRYSTTGYGNVCTLMNNATNLTGISSVTLPTVNTWGFIDGIWVANASTLTLRFSFSGGSGNSARAAQIDNVMVISLTSSFSSQANEPTITELRDAITAAGGYWDGAREVPVGTIKVTGVVLNKGHIDIVEGDTTTIEATIIPANATNHNIIWSSYDSSVATIVSTGLVTGLISAVAPGNTNILATTEDQGYTRLCSITVTGSTVIPVVTLIAPTIGTLIEMSTISGWNIVAVKFKSNVSFTRFVIMANGGSGHDIGKEVGSGGAGSAGTQITYTITAAAFEDTQIGKLWRLDVYVLSTGGIWSDGSENFISFITVAATGDRNDFDSSVGYEFECITDSIITRVGRPLNGIMNQTHIVYIWDVASTALLGLADITPAAELDSHGFKVALLNNPVTLKAGKRYRIVSSEWLNGDKWYDIDMENPLKRTDSFTIIHPVYGVEGKHNDYPDSAYPPGGSNGYVGVTFFYPSKP